MRISCHPVHFALPALLAAGGMAVSAQDDDGRGPALRLWVRMREVQADIRTVKTRCEIVTALSAIGRTQLETGVVHWLRKPDGTVCQRWDLALEATDDSPASRSTLLVLGDEILTIVDGKIIERGQLRSPEILNLPALGGPVLQIPSDADLRDPEFALGSREERISDDRVLKPHPPETDGAAPAPGSLQPGPDGEETADFTTPGIDVEDANAGPRIAGSPEALLTLTARRGAWKDLLNVAYVYMDTNYKLVREYRFGEIGNNQYVVRFLDSAVNVKLDEKLFLPPDGQSDPGNR